MFFVMVGMVYYHISYCVILGNLKNRLLKNRFGLELGLELRYPYGLDCVPLTGLE